MIVRKLSAGDIVEAKCTRCKTVMNHRIIAMVEDRIVRVECNTCNGAHNYHESKKPKPTSTKSAADKTLSVPKNTKKSAESSEKAEWSNVMESIDQNLAIPYDMNRKYAMNDLLRHSAFGLGIVKQILKPQKMNVLFESGKKLLKCL